jgi:glutaredoxin
MADLFTQVRHRREEHRVVFYGLSTCGWCRKARTFLDDNEITYELCYVDQLEGDERKQAIEEVAKVNPKKTFPTIIVDEEEVLVGYDKERYEEKLL